MGDRRQVKATVMKSVTICIRQPMQQLHRVPDENSPVARGPRNGCMPEVRLEPNVWPGDSSHCARTRMIVQCMSSTNPQATTLPATAGHNNTLQAPLIVLVSVHANLHIALYRERGKLYTGTSSPQNRCQHLYHKRERRGVALNARTEREGKGAR